MAEKSSEERLADLLSRGVDSTAAKTASVSSKMYNSLITALTLANNPTDAKEIALINSGVNKISPRVGHKGRELLWKSIADGRVSSNARLEAAMGFLGAVYQVDSNNVKVEEGDVEIDIKGFEEAAGVGVVVGKEEIERAVEKEIEKNREELVERRYHFGVNKLLGPVIKVLRFAEGKEVLVVLNRKVEELLGPKTEKDLVKPAKKKKKAKAKKAGGVQGNGVVKGKGKEGVNLDEGKEEPVDPFEGIPSNMTGRALDSLMNSPALMEKHKKATGGKIITRFPPEPNGYLHVGHAKAMFLDFGYARKMNGECILRFDDTNPVTEKTEYIDSIVETVKWMGHSPTRITYSSDYFTELYQLGKELIRRGKAYVCHQSSEEMKRDRETKTESPWRDRDSGESLRLFEDMKKGKYGEGEATLRMKIDMKSANPVMRDPIAYRVKHAPHPRTGDTWCIYPSYDYTHCIVDSLEWITHSLCTLEFEIRRDSYYWLLEALDLYRPYVWEFSRLNVTHTIMSKRRLLHLVKENRVRGWDDPRMPTLMGMRRRGYPSTALNRFCAAIGVSRAKNIISYNTLEYWIRTELDSTAPRAFMVLKPLKVTITNFKEEETLEAPNHPKKSELGIRKLSFTKEVYINSSDFRKEDSKGYYGLAPGKVAMLRHAYPITVDSMVTDDNGIVTELKATCDYDKSVKPKGVLHWVSGKASKAEVRLYNHLFKTEDVSTLDKATWLDDINPDSEVVVENALIEESLTSAKTGDKFQFERTGYFVCDQDSTLEKKVFNLTVSLRESR